MVKLTIDMLIRKKSGQLSKKRDESLTKFLRKKSHLNLENRQITEIGTELAACTNLLVLYLYDNQLTEIPDLDKNVHIEAIYMQNNKISRIEHLNKLSKLKKIYLGHNEIYLVEGFENTEILEELNMENQRMAPGDSLIVDPMSINAFARTLTILNMAGNNLTSISPFETCSNLKITNFSNNLIEDLNETTDIIAKNWFSIAKMDFTRNPISSMHKYKDELILSAINTLEILDDKEIPAVTKHFLKGLKSKLELKNNEKSSKVSTKMADKGDNMKSHRNKSSSSLASSSSSSSQQKANSIRKYAGEFVNKSNSIDSNIPNISPPNITNEFITPSSSIHVTKSATNKTPTNYMSSKHDLRSDSGKTILNGILKTSSNNLLSYEQIGDDDVDSDVEDVIKKIKNMDKNDDVDYDESSSDFNALIRGDGDSQVRGTDKQSYRNKVVSKNRVKFSSATEDELGLN